jgi:CDP-diacylglycerol--serine O-phosphatidyltransferase
VRRRALAEPYLGHSSRPSRLDPRTAAAIAAIPPVGDPVALASPPAGSGAPDRVGWLLPGEQTAARRLRFLVVNACTLAALSLGVLAILLAMRGEVQTAAACLIGCVVLDGLDGLLARRLGVATPFGSQLDSLADMCTFGIAAPVVVYASVVAEGPGGAVAGLTPTTGAGTGTSAGTSDTAGLVAGTDTAGLVAGSVPPAVAAVVCALVAGCAAIRLARFNISPRDSRFFSGVPTTLAAAVLAVAVLIDLPVPPAVQLGGVVVLAFAMVSGFPYASLARLLRLPPWLWLAPLAAALVDARLTFLALVVGYLVSGPLLWLHQRRVPAG